MSWNWSISENKNDDANLKGSIIQSRWSLRLINWWGKDWRRSTWTLKWVFEKSKAFRSNEAVERTWRKMTYRRNLIKRNRLFTEIKTIIDLRRRIMRKRKIWGIV